VLVAVDCSCNSCIAVAALNELISSTLLVRARLDGGPVTLLPLDSDLILRHNT